MTAMTDDERAIRDLVQTWMDATRARDVDAVLALMTDDVVFLVAGKPPMDKAGFARQARDLAKPGGPTFEGRSDLREVRVDGDHAYAWAHLVVTVTAPDQPPMRREGHTLTVFRRDGGRWRLARDANLLVTAA